MPWSSTRRPDDWTNESTGVIAEFLAEIRKDQAIADDLDRIAAHGDVAGWITAAKRYASGELERQCGPDHFGTRLAFAACIDADWRQLADSGIRAVDAVERTIAQRQSFVERLGQSADTARGRA